MKKTIWAAALTTGIAVASVIGTPAVAQSFPNLVKIVVPFPAGGTTDILARDVAVSLSEKLGTTVIVENRAGASGAIGSEIVARSAPDGGTMLLTATHHVINPGLYKKLPYDTAKDFSPVALIGSVPNALLVNPGIPAKTVAELIALAKKDPGKLTFGSSGIGGANHLSGELFKFMANIDIEHVPYKGAAPAMTDLLGGHLPMMFDSLPTVLPAVASGKVRVLAVTSKTRSAALPEIPTMDEAGVKGFEATAWFGMYMPANNGSPVQARLEAVMKEILASDTIKAKFAKLDVDPGNLTGKEFTTFVNVEMAKWSDVIQRAKIEAQ